MAVDSGIISCKRNLHEMAATRSYRMQARAAAAEEATERILDVAEELFWENPARQVTLSAVAERAEVSVHSIIRRFGGQEGMIEAAARRSQDRINTERGDAVPGDLQSVVTALVDHYELMGDRVLAMLTAETRSPAIKDAADMGRALHEDWCERFFAPALRKRRGGGRQRLLAQVIAICDVYTWMLLRRQRGLSRRETEHALIEMLEPLTDGRSHQ
jgi:AcrR family transcriptional regulator